MDGLVSFFTWLLSPETLNAYSTFVIAIFTIVLAWVGYCQARLIRKSIDLARAEYISTHRPRIVLREANLIAETIHYTLVNLGGTQATIIQSWIFAEFIEDGTRWRPLWPAADDASISTQLTFIGGQSRDLQFALPDEISFAIKWPEAMRIGTERGPSVIGKIYFAGALVYEDSMGMKRRSIFRRRWDPHSLNFVRLTPEQERDYEYAD
jgi:hypothetical protein